MRNLCVGYKFVQNSRVLERFYKGIPIIEGNVLGKHLLAKSCLGGIDGSDGMGCSCSYFTWSKAIFHQ